MIHPVKHPDMDDDIHISGLGFSAANTLCGITDSIESEDVYEEVPNCKQCIELYNMVKNHRPRFKFK